MVYVTADGLWNGGLCRICLHSAIGAEFLCADLEALTHPLFDDVVEIMLSRRKAVMSALMPLSSSNCANLWAMPHASLLTTTIYISLIRE